MPPYTTLAATSYPAADMQDRTGGAELPALAASALALLVLTIGQIMPDARLTISGVPLNALLVAAAAVYSFVVPVEHLTRRDLAFVFLLISPLAVTLLWSIDQETGAVRLANLLSSAFVAAVLLLYSIQRIGLTRCFRVWIFAFACLLGLALVYKALFGFFDRGVSFLFNGPNVFARQMGIAALLSAFLCAGWARWIGMAVFALAVLWTQSKGPLLALSVAGIFAAFHYLGARGRLALVTSFGLAAAIVVANVALLRDIELLSRLFLAMTFFESGITNANYGSIGTRIDMISITIGMIADNPFGVGVGGWAARAGLSWAEYPHNIFLEILSEGGLILGTLALVPYFLFVRSRVAPLVAVCWFLCLCQQVSGSLADSRFWLALSAVAFVYGRASVSGR